MKHNVYIKLFLCCLIILTSFIAHAKKQEIQNGEDEILFISSYNSDTKYNYDAIKNFSNYFLEKDNNYEIAVENMNQTMLSNIDEWTDNVSKLTSKHPRAKLLILMGGEAWNGYIYSKNKKVKEIPAILMMASRFGFTPPSPDENLQTYLPKSIDFKEVIKGTNVKACYAYEYSIEKNIELAKHFYPNTKHIALLSDNTYSGLAQLTQMRECLKKYPNLNGIYIDGRQLTLDEAIEKVESMPTNTAMMLGIWRINSRNISFIDNAAYIFKNAMPDVPVFSITGTGFGYWAIGGYTPNYDGTIRLIVNKAYEVLNSENSNNQEFISLSASYRFDEKMIKQKGLQDIIIPQESIIINKTPTFLELYRKEVDILIFTFAFLFIALIISLIFYFKMRVLKNKLFVLATQLQQDKIALKRSEKEMLVAKENAEKANMLKSTFVSNISHEIRTPLNSIVGFSSLLVNSLDVTEEQKEYAGIIQLNSDLLLQLINDVLDVSRLESGKLLFNYENIDLVSLCKNIIIATRLHTKVNIDLVFSNTCNQYYLYTDPLRLQQLITNLLNNALKFTPENGCISLTFEEVLNSNQILFSVTDTGSGVPDDKHDLIFERFEKVDEFKQGTGLGLSICRLIIHQMHGEIWIDKNYKNGARFYFSLPITKEKQ